MKQLPNSNDRYVKVDAPNIVWVVDRVISISDPVPHVRLVQEGTPNRQITLSASALKDTSLYKKLEA